MPPRQHNPNQVAKTLWHTELGGIWIFEPSEGAPLKPGHILAIDVGGTDFRQIDRYVVTKINRTKNELKLLKTASTREARLIDLVELTKGI